MNKFDPNKEKTKVGLAPRMVFGIRTDVSNNIQFFAWDKVAYLAGNYLVIYSLKDKAQYFFPAHPDYGEITSFSVDEYIDYIVIVLTQRPMLLYTRIVNKNTFKETEVKVSDHEEPDSNEYFMSIAVNSSKSYILALTGPKTPATIKIFMDEIRGGKRGTTSFRMTNQAAYNQVNINVFNPYYMAVFGEGGFAVLQINDQDKKTITKIEVNPQSNLFQEFSNYLFNIVACTWVSKNRVAFMNASCDVFVIEFYNKHKMENVYKKVIKSVNVFENQVRGKAIFSRNGNIYVCRDDGVVSKLEDKQQTEKNMIYEKKERANKFIQNLPKMDIHGFSLTNPVNSSSTYSAVVISSVSGQIYYVDITNDNALYDGNNFKFLISAFHSEEILCLDVCKQKPLLVSCGRDRTICIWNFQTNQLELSELLDDEVSCLAFHPNGLILACLFYSKMQILHVLDKKLHVFRELVLYQPTDVRFSNNGIFLAVSYKNCFQVYNSYSMEVVFTSKSKDGVQYHSDEVRSVTWDVDDRGFATCGLDGRAFYWRLYNKEGESQIAIEYSNPLYKFIGVDICSNKQNDSKKLFMLDETALVQAEYKNISEDDSDGRDGNNKDEDEDTNNFKKFEVKPTVILSNQNFSKFFYDSDTRLIFFGTNLAHTPSIHVANYPYVLEKKDFSSFQANSLGIKWITASKDMKFLFTCGSDKCLFFFDILNTHKFERKDESTFNNELILMRREDLDKDSFELKAKLNKLDSEIKRELDEFEILFRDVKKEIEDSLREEISEKQKFEREIKDLKEKTEIETKKFEKTMKEMLQDHEEKIEELTSEHLKSKQVKERDREKELEMLKNEKSKNEAHTRYVKKTNEQEIQQFKEYYHNIISELNKGITILQETKENVSESIEKEKLDKIESNDNQIAVRRIKLEEMKNFYQKIKSDHHKDEEKLRYEIKEIKSLIKVEEEKKVDNRNYLSTLINENNKLNKNITELIRDKKEKEETIIEKNSIRMSLDKENQELEKFKFVLNYKIKELKLEKDPKENKLSVLERQARDMEKEIKNFEFSQANYIVDLSTNHEIMKLHERHILETEKSIEKLKSYVKLFQEALYMSMKKAKNHKDLKKELVKLKELFLDLDYIENLEKPLEQNYEVHRNFLENAIADFKSKLDNGRVLLSQDFSKIMRENKRLLTIVNELEKEKKEIEAASFESYNLSKSVNNLKPKIALKPALPKISHKGSENSLKNKLAKYKKELYELEKELEFIKETRKKDQARKEKNEKRLKTETGNGINVSKSMDAF